MIRTSEPFGVAGAGKDWLNDKTFSGVPPLLNVQARIVDGWEVFAAIVGVANESGCIIVIVGRKNSTAKLGQDHAYMYLRCIFSLMALNSLI